MAIRRIIKPTPRQIQQYSYCNDEYNWIRCCAICKQEDDEHWKGMWKDYYESQGMGGC